MHSSDHSPPARHWAIIAALVVLTVATLGRSANHNFVNYDDPLYVTDNGLVQRGLSLSSLRDGFIGPNIGHWHPLTWYSLIIEYELFGLNPGGYHAVSVLLHCLNALLVFLLLRHLTNAVWASACAAALFAVHPLHVEPVAWVSSRKDVLSTCFWLFALIMYAEYVDRGKWWRYGATLGLFLLGLTAKPMVITLPVTLLLLDYWPLRRAKPWRELIVEKVPFFAFSVVSAGMTYWAGVRGNAVRTIDEIEPMARLLNPWVHYVQYLAKTFRPTGLAVPYPMRGEPFPLPIVAACLLLLAIVTVAAVVFRKRVPFLTMGWLWFLLTLFPVAGFVPAGGQSMADRYMYVPLLGLIIAVVWLGRYLVQEYPRARTAAVAAGAVAVALCAGLAFRQAEFWRDSGTLFAHALEVTGENALAHYNFAKHHYDKGDLDTAEEHFLKAMEIAPNDFEARANLGIIYLQRDDVAAARRQFDKAAAINPGDFRSNFQLGSTLLEKGYAHEAVPYLQSAVRLDGRSIAARMELGRGLALTGQPDAAAEQFQAILDMKNHPDAHFNLAVAFVQQQNLDKAEEHFREALRLRPGDVDARYALAVVLHTRGEGAEAREALEQVLQESPGHQQAQALLKKLGDSP